MNKNLSICIIDDDDIYQYTITRAIKKANVSDNVLVFSDGEEAINYFTSNASKNNKMPDVVLLDLNMPIMDGWDFLDSYIKLKPKLKKEINIFVVTSSVDQNDYNKVKTIPEVRDYIIKPMSEESIIDIISEL